MDANDNKSADTPLTPEIEKSADLSLTPAIKKKQPYIKPAFRYETVFVTSALSCGKTPNSSFQCNSAPKAS